MNKKNPAKGKVSSDIKNFFENTSKNNEKKTNKPDTRKRKNNTIIEKENIKNPIAIKVSQNRCLYILENKLDLNIGDMIVVKTIRGLEIAETVPFFHKCCNELKRQFIHEIVRKATDNDIKLNDENKEDEKKAYKKCTELIEKHNLEMELIKVYYLLDKAKIIFFFKSANKVDFRELVKDLASIFRTRIELRQIGVRDEAKLIGGIGSCGRETCCSSWMDNFNSVSIKMVKDQNLSMNSTKVSGLCGRLMCCLYYEYDFYAAERKKYPKQGKSTTIDGIKYKIIQVDVIQKRICIQNEEKKIQWLTDIELDDFIKKWQLEKKKRIKEENMRKQKKLEAKNAKKNESNKK